MLSFLVLLIFVILFTRVFSDIYLRIIFGVMIYPALFMAYMNEGGEGSRIVAIGENYYNYLYAQSFWAYLLCVFLFFLPFYVKRHHRYDYTPIDIPIGAYTFILFIYFIFSVISYPWVFGLIGHRQSILPGNAWSSFYVVSFCFLVFAYKSKYWFLFVLAFLVSFFIVLSGERADSVLILLTGAMILFRNRVQKYDLNIIGWVKIILIFFITFSFFVLVGNYRDYGEFRMYDIVKSIVVQATVVDATHVFFTAIWVGDNYNKIIDPVINIIYSFVPFHPYSGASSDLFFGNILKDFIPNAGGGLFPSPFIMAGGIGAAAVMSYVSGWIVRLLWSNKGLYNALFFVLFLLSFRIFWYGVFYVFKPIYVMSIFWLILIVYFSAHRKLRYSR